MALLVQPSKMADQPKASTSTRAIPPPLNSALRKPTPSPLQVSQISTPLTNNFVHTGPKDFGSPHSSKGDAGTSPFTPRSPHYSPVFLSDQNDSLNGGELSSVASRNATQEPMRPDVSERRKHSPLVTPRGNELQATRNVSALSQSSAAVTTDSPPHSPSEIALSKVRAVDHRPVERLGPRTSSIDSTMSSVSSTTSYSHASSDPLSPSPAEIAQMVASAGSVDQLIRQLVKEKKQSAAQNAQLWRLINKQRTLIMGLNEDFARALEEKKKYHQRYKELSASLRPHPTQRVDEVRKMSPSGTSSAGSDEELPIQRHSALLSGKQQAPFMGESGSTEEGDAANHTVDHRATAILSPTQVPSQVSPSTTSPSIPSEGMPKAMQESEASDASDEDDSRRHTIMQSNFRAIAPFEMHKKLPPAIDPSSEPRTPLAQDVDMGPSPSSFSARRSLTTPRKSAHNSPHVGGDSPIEGPPTLTSPMSRRGPPAPLNLQQRPVQPPQPLKSPDRYGPEDRSEPEYDEALEAERAPKLERGRRKTREEDDKEREFVMKKEAESRSQSKKQKRPKSGSKSGPASPTKQSATSPTQSLPKSPVIRAFSPNESPTSLQEHFSPHASLAGVLSGPSSSANSIVEQSVTIMASPPLSPGLPRSPRPIDRPLNSPAPRAPIDSNVSSPPLSPRPGTLSPPELLSPRAPRHPIPLPPHTPTSLTSPHCSISEDDKAASMRSRSPTLQPPPQSPPNLQPPQSPKSPVKALSPQSPKSPRKGTSAPLAQVSSNPSSENMSAGIFRGFRSEAYPDLLLPPNALPLILIKVTSSRLRPSRHSMLSMKSMEEDPVFTLGITARSNMKPLWRVEKPIMSMPQLDQQLKQISSFEFRLPDRSLFTGHAPAKIDARREALERYFEDVLDTEMRDPAALILCNFLSSQVVPVEDYEGSNPSNSNEGPQQVHLGPDGRIIKEGFLTKRGKNFGGWKARYFVLDEPVLRYYESPGGALLGTIKLMNAQIGKQAANHSSSHSPSRAGEEHDKEFRHAFLILEPKKKDSNSFLRHVLCAESDAERDDWVGALLQYIGQIAPEGRSKTASKGILSSMMRSGKEESPVGSERSHEDSAKGLQGVNYEDTVAGQPVKMGSSQGTPSPLSSSFNGNQGMMASPPSRSISGPTNGVVIQDPQAFNKRPVEGPKVRDTQKKRSLFAFRDRQPDSNASTPNNSMAAMARPQTSSTMGRPVFGMPLAEAVETFPARGSDLALPAVVYRCLEYLEAKEAVDEEGIFRLSGSNVVIKQLRERFNTEGDVDFLGEGTHYDVHAIASLLKAYLRELPANVLGPRELQVRFATVLGMISLSSVLPSSPFPSFFFRTYN